MHQRVLQLAPVWLASHCRSWIHLEKFPPEQEGVKHLQPRFFGRLNGTRHKPYLEQRAQNSADHVLRLPNRGQELNANFFSQTFRAPPGISRQKSQDIPPKPGFEGHTELFGPHSFTWRIPTPPEDIQTKMGLDSFFLPDQSRTPNLVMAPANSTEQLEWLC